MLSVGFSAWKREPVLYQKTSFISPVASRVLTRSSPAVPCGRTSSSMRHVRVRGRERVRERLRTQLRRFGAVDEIGELDRFGVLRRGGE